MIAQILAIALPTVALRARKSDNFCCWNSWKRIDKKGMTFDRDFCYFILLSLPSFLGGKRKGETNNQSRGKNSWLSARSLKRYKYICKDSNAEKKPCTAMVKTVTAKILSNSEHFLNYRFHINIFGKLFNSINTNCILSSGIHLKQSEF